MAPDGDLPASTYKHDQALTIHRTMKHAITDGIVDFDIVDEVYNHVWLSPKIQVLLETNHPLSEKPVAWICPYQKSRVVYIQLAHGRQAHENAGYRKVVRNAVRWAAPSRWRALATCEAAAGFEPRFEPAPLGSTRYAGGNRRRS